MTDTKLLEKILEFRSKPENQSPHGNFLDLKILDVSSGKSLVQVPYNTALAGNATTGILHGGVITTTLDAACGVAVIAALARQTAIATLDLRIDYLKPATPGLAVTASGHCYKVAKDVCFVRGLAYHHDPEDPIANCTATFMVTGTPMGKTQTPTGTTQAPAGMKNTEQSTPKSAAEDRR
ncbi:MAG: PaaI family thioesterase [Porticoccaceae bacterium]